MSRPGRLAGATGDEIAQRARLIAASTQAGPGGSPADARRDARQVLDDRRYEGAEVPRPLAGPIEWLGDRVQPVIDWIDDLGSGVPGGPIVPLPEVELGTAATWDVSAVSGDDVAAVRAFLERRNTLQSEARSAIAAELYSRLRPRVGGASEQASNERFLELLVAAKAARS